MTGKCITGISKHTTGQSWERGQVLAMSLVLLMLGGFLVIPLLDLMNGSIVYSRTIEDYNDRYYTADAGLQYALWAIKKDPSMLPPAEPAEEATIELDFPEADETLNGVAAIAVTITNLGDHIYRIISTATGTNGRIVQIQCDVYFFNLSHLAMGAMTSDCGVTVQNSTIDGDIYYCDDCGDAKINNSTYDNLYDKCQTNWPTADELKTFYGDDVDKDNPFPYATIYASQYPQGIGPLYRNGNLTIDNTDKNNPTLTLNGTIYVTGNLAAAQAGSKKYTLNLNGKTIFVEGSISFASGVTVTGSGCIIAVGDINFQPNIASSNTDFILVMSVNGKVNFQPNGSFYGALVGDSSVDMKNGTIIWTDPTGKGLDFPGLGSDEGGSGKPKIRTYLITSSSSH